MSLQPHQQRVVDEKTDLDDKRSKLNGFFGSVIFAGLPKDEQSRLWQQIEVMDDYSRILGQRIAAFSQ
jgi:mannose/cellobiose epimerase-like protein (N-acyl-D-glucosamine 2-epimerase family)